MGNRLKQALFLNLTRLCRPCIAALAGFGTIFIIPPAYEVFRGVYSFLLSVRSSVLPSVHPSGVNILCQSFA